MGRLGAVLEALGWVLGGSWALLAGPWGTQIDFPAVLIAKIEFSKTIDKHKEKQQCWLILASRGRSWGLLGRSWSPLPSTVGLGGSKAAKSSFFLTLFTSLFSLHFFFSFFAPSWPPFGRHLGVPRVPKLASSWPNFGPSRLLTPRRAQKRRFSRNTTFSHTF